MSLVAGSSLSIPDGVLLKTNSGWNLSKASTALSKEELHGPGDQRVMLFPSYRRDLQKQQVGTLYLTERYGPRSWLPG